MANILEFTKPHVLRNEAEYNAAVKEIDDLLDADPPSGSDAYERLEFLSVLVQAYEDANFPFTEQPKPQDVVDFILAQKGLSRSDLSMWMGGKSRTSEFYSGARRLSVKQIKTLRLQLGIPADLLIGP